MPPPTALGRIIVFPAPPIGGHLVNSGDVQVALGMRFCGQMLSSMTRMLTARMPLKHQIGGSKPLQAAAFSGETSNGILPYNVLTFVRRRRSSQSERLEYLENGLS